MKITIILAISLVLSSCATTSVQQFISGFKKTPYIEPEGGDYAYLTIEAPTLKKMLGLHDKIDVFIYDRCIENSEDRKDGYIGGFLLSSKESIGKKRQVKISSNGPAFIEVGYDQPTGIQCTNKFHLKPENNATYHIQWQWAGGKCSALAKKLGEDGQYKESDEITQRNNDGNILVGGSGRTTSEWRVCKTST